MVKNASELKNGDVIRFEYGDYDNWVECTVIDAEIEGNAVYVKGCRMGQEYGLTFSRNEGVQVLKHGDAEV